MTTTTDLASARGTAEAEDVRAPPLVEVRIRGFRSNVYTTLSAGSMCAHATPRLLPRPMRTSRISDRP